MRIRIWCILQNPSWVHKRSKNKKLAGCVVTRRRSHSSPAQRGSTFEWEWPHWLHHCAALALPGNVCALHLLCAYIREREWGVGSRGHSAGNPAVFSPPTIGAGPKIWTAKTSCHPMLTNGAIQFLNKLSTELCTYYSRKFTVGHTAPLVCFTLIHWVTLVCDDTTNRLDCVTICGDLIHNTYMCVECWKPPEKYVWSRRWAVSDMQQ